jgi:ankyrin repeat protein
MVITKYLLITSMFVSSTIFFSCFGIHNFESSDALYNKIKEFIDFGFDENEIIHALKKNVSKETALNSIVNTYGNTVLHLSCREGDIEIARIVLEALDDEAAKVILRQSNKNINPYYVESTQQETPFLLAFKRAKYPVAKFLLEYTEKRFGTDFTKEMILAEDTTQSNVLHYFYTPKSVELIKSILEYFKDQNFLGVMNKENIREYSPLMSVQRMETPEEIKIHVRLYLQELFNMSEDACYKMVYHAE